MWELDCKESWAPKNSCFWTVVLEKTLESPLDSKEIQPVHPKGDQSWVFIGRTDAEAETPIFWPPDAKSWHIWKDPDSGKDWGQEEKEMTEDEMVEWHHQLDGHGFGWTPGVGDGQGGLVCHGSWSCKESDATERLNWTEMDFTESIYLFSQVFSGISRVFLIYNIKLFANSDSFISSFPIWMLFVTSSSSLLWFTPPTLHWTESGRMGNLVLFLTLEGSISFSQLNMMLSVVLSYAVWLIFCCLYTQFVESF